MPVGSFELAEKEFKKSEIELVCAGSNLVDEVWAAEKPKAPQEKVWHLEDKYSG